MEKELNLIIIWENGRVAENEILADLNENFSICECIDMEWTEEHFHTNMTRFYGQKLPKGSHKEKHCGKGRFLLVTFFDENPIYTDRETSRGPELVNTNVFDKKQLYRNWTGGGHKIHTTNGSHETAHDLMLLLGHNIEEYVQRFENGIYKESQVKLLTKNLEGSDGWDSFSHMFKVVNTCIDYVVMRNFEALPDTFTVDEHGDVDFLTSDVKDFSYILNAKKSANAFRPYAYDINVASVVVPCDIRAPSDGYYDEIWERDILSRASLSSNGFFKPCLNDFIPMLAYHALIHKVKISNSYKNIFNSYNISLTNLSPLLSSFMKENNYSIEYPKDLSVYFHFLNAKKLDAPIKKINIISFCIRNIRQMYLIEFRTFIKKMLKR
jgi:hypothetical protein